MKTLSLITAVLVVSNALAFGQVPPVPNAAPAATPEKPAGPPKEEKKDRFLFVKKVDLYPVSGPSLRGVDILIKNDKVEAIGENLDVPKGAEILDAAGLRAYPGMVSLNGDQIIGARTKDQTNPFGLTSMMGLASGITTVVTGQTAIKITQGSVEGSLLRDNLFIGLFYSSQNPRAKVQVRADLAKAREYLKLLAEFNAKKAAGDQTAKEPDQRPLGQASRYLPLLRGEVPAVFNVSEANDLIDAAELAQTFGFRAVMRGAVEGWTVADRLGRAGITCIVSPRARDDADPTTNRPNGSKIENAAILHRHGVKVAVCTEKSSIDIDGQAGQDALYLATDAGMAQRGGLDEDAALASVTLEAARAMGLDDRIGTIEVGKDADIVITDGELLHYETMVQWAIVNGRIAYDKQKETLYRDIRPRAGAKKPEAQWWPRRFAPMADEWRYDPAEEAAKASSQAATSASAPTSQPAPGERGPGRGPRGRMRGDGAGQRPTESRPAESRPAESRPAESSHTGDGAPEIK